MSFAAEPDEPALKPPAGLLARLREDPLHAPEHIALAAADVHAPPAARWASAARRDGRYSPYTLGEMARKRHAHMTGMTGAATGVGGLVTMVPDLVSLAWLQSRMVFFIAGAFGWDPFDPMRPAELLALTDLLHRPRGRARDARRDGRQLAWPSTGSAPSSSATRRWRRKLFVMVGKKAGRSIAGRMIPGFAIAYNAVSNRHDTNKLGRRAIAFYGQRPAAHTGTAAPLTALDASSHRNAMIVAIFSGGTRFTHSLSGIAARLAGVSIIVGRTALQRTPSGLPSCATAFAKAITAALLAV